MNTKVEENLMLDEMDYYYKLSTMTPEEKEAFYTMKREALNIVMNHIAGKNTLEDNT